jgi:hypothetical protein
MQFDFQGWGNNVQSKSAPHGAPQTGPPRKGSGGLEDVIELSRSATDAQGRIQLERAEDGSDEYTQTGDIPLALKGKLARRRNGEETKATPFRQRVDMGPTISTLIRLATQPSRELDPFMHAFPTASSRNLFQHYVDNTAGIVTALGRSKPVENPFLQVSLPLVLGDTSVPGHAALRFALLATSAVHILHLHGGDGDADLCSRLKKLAIGYTVISQSEIDKERGGKPPGALISPKAQLDNDLVLAACVVLLTRDVLSADPTWRANLDFALACVRGRGGAEALLAAEPGNFMRRFVLEQLATHEVFSCFSTGGEPTLLTPHARWWFDVEKSSRTNAEWESVENQFGISRAMVEVIARVRIGWLVLVLVLTLTGVRIVFSQEPPRTHGTP